MEIVSLEGKTYGEEENHSLKNRKNVKSVPMVCGFDK